MKVSPRKPRSVISVAVPDISDRRLTRTRSAGASVSGSRNAVITSDATAAAQSTQKIARQSATAITPDPASGASMGETEITSMINAIKPRRRVPGMHVADDRARDDHDDCCPETLHEAPQRQRCNIARKDAADGAKDEDRDADIQRRLTARLVGPGAVDQLREAEGHEERGHRRLHGGDGCVQVGGDGRHRGQVHVDGERADAGQKAEDNGRAEQTGLHGKLLQNVGDIAVPAWLADPGGKVKGGCRTVEPQNAICLFPPP